MTQTKKVLRKTCALCAALLALSNPASADSYHDARAELIAAYEAKDFAAMRISAGNALNARPGFAGALFNLALAEALDGDAAESLATLNRLLEQKVDFAVAGQPEFSALLELPGWPAYENAVAALYEPIGIAQVAYSYDQADFVPEGIAIDDDGLLYLGSIRHGDIVRVASKGSVVARAQDGPHWSVYGMRIKDDKLWFVSSAVSQFAKLEKDDLGSNALLELDPATGTVTRRATIPAKDAQQVLGDLLFVDATVLLLADQTEGSIYQYDLANNKLTVLVEGGVIGSPQGMVLNEAGDHAYVADYIGGLVRVELATGAVVAVEARDAINVYGIDGLYRYKNRLIAIQNGVRPNRVSTFTLSDDGLSVTGSNILAMNLEVFDEPNLGQVVGDSFYFIANSHWNRFDREGNLPADLAGPIVLKIDLDKDD
jgi:sugar lactone lactonase YvrE